jgi:hypothetical protein
VSPPPKLNRQSSKSTTNDAGSHLWVILMLADGHPCHFPIQLGLLYGSNVYKNLYLPLSPTMVREEQRGWERSSACSVQYLTLKLIVWNQTNMLVTSSTICFLQCIGAA